MKINQFDKSTCEFLRAVMQKALNEAGVDGATFHVGNMRFTETACNIKVAVTTDSNYDIKIIQIAKLAAGRGCSIEGNTNARGWVLVEFKNSNKIYKWIAKDSNGKRFKMSNEQMRFRFGQ